PAIGRGPATRPRRVETGFPMSTRRDIRSSAAALPDSPPPLLPGTTSRDCLKTMCAPGTDPFHRVGALPPFAWDRLPVVPLLLMGSRPPAGFPPRAEPR